MLGYLKNSGIFSCPSRPDVTCTSNTDSSIAYGYNYWMSTWYYPDAGLATIQKPAETVLVAETGGSGTTSAGSYLSYTPYYSVVLAPTNATYGVQVANAPARLTDRHSDGLNIAWCDGHVKWMKRSAVEADTGNTTASLYWWGR